METAFLLTLYVLPVVLVFALLSLLASFFED